VHEIRNLEADDWDRWLPLWNGYLQFYRAELSDATTKSTFERISGQSEGLFGFLAVSEAGEGVGLAHCLLHPTTWSRRPYCYLEDLFVAPSARGTELGRALLQAAKSSSVSRGAERLYWHTQQYNGRARSLYDQIARPTSFMVYEM
jgi:GNAT superfamily N-acetyltransferase